jgi:hypothetical protein
MLVALDLTPFKADNPEACEDTLIESCLSVVRYALERRIETTLVYGEGEDIRSYTGQDLRAFDEIYYAMGSVGFSSKTPLTHLLTGAQQAQMLYLFCMEAPDGELLLALPTDKPVELAVVRTRKKGAALPESAGSLNVTELLL